MANFVNITLIKIADNRQRREFPIESHQELVESIRKLGILHPPVVRKEGDAFILVAGERRLRAMQDIIELDGQVFHEGQPCPAEAIPYTFLGDLDPLDAEEAELDENIRREDLTWQERAKATTRLEALRGKLADAGRGETPTLSSLTLELKGVDTVAAQTETRREAIVARHLDKPEIAAAKSVHEAYKMLKKTEQREKHAQLSAAVGKTFSASQHTTINADSLEWMKAAEAGQFDVILTDPPYGMGADTFGDSGGIAAGAHAYVDDAETLTKILAVLGPESYRLTKDEAHLYCFCDIGQFALLSSTFVAAGWNVFRTPLIWHKPNGSRAPWPENGPQRKYETILYAVKGKKKVTKIFGDVISCDSDTNLGHAAQKPVELLKNLLGRSCTPGDRVFDPFSGTGSLLPAAHDLQLYATCVELDPAHHGIAIERLKALK